MQIFGIVILNSFVFFLNNPLFLVFGAVWIAIFWYSQGEIINLTQKHVFENRLKGAISSLTTTQERIKFIATIFFIIVLIDFLTGNYPFPKQEIGLLEEILFLAVSIVVSGYVGKKLGKLKIQKPGMSYFGQIVVALAVGGSFVVFALVFSHNFFIYTVL